MLSAHNTCLCCSFLLTVSLLHGRHSCTNFSNVGPSCGPQFSKNCSSNVSFHGVQSFRNRLLPCPASSCMDSSPQSTAPARSSLECGLLPGCYFLQGIPTCCALGSLLGVKWGSAPLLTSMGYGSKSSSLWAVPQAAGESAPAPPPSLALVPAGLLLSHLLPPSCCCTVVFTPFLIPDHRGPPSIAGWLSLSQWWVRPGALWSQLCPTWGQLLVSPHRQSLCRPLLPTPGHANLPQDDEVVPRGAWGSQGKHEAGEAVRGAQRFNELDSLP